MKWARLTSDQLDVYNDVRSIYSISLVWARLYVADCT